MCQNWNFTLHTSFLKNLTDVLFILRMSAACLFWNFCMQNLHVFLYLSIIKRIWSLDAMAEDFFFVYRSNSLISVSFRREGYNHTRGMWTLTHIYRLLLTHLRPYLCQVCSFLALNITMCIWHRVFFLFVFAIWCLEGCSFRLLLESWNIRNNLLYTL
jgi:hypothetical protein